MARKTPSQASILNAVATLAAAGITLPQVAVPQPAPSRRRPRTSTGLLRRSVPTATQAVPQAQPLFQYQGQLFRVGADNELIPVQLPQAVAPLAPQAVAPQPQAAHVWEAKLIADDYAAHHVGEPCPFCARKNLPQSAFAGARWHTNQAKASQGIAQYTFSNCDHTVNYRAQ